ncbi:MAG: TonB-dependent receptor [Akkermansiaceae bacterium]|nr:TonB-dependent receptor [Akkermansiaceae bacterium]
MNRAYQIGVRWEPRADLDFWLRYDRLYRLPSTDEIASYQGFPLSEPFNAELKAETGNNYELGGEYRIDGWKLRGNGFLQQLTGEIGYDFQKNLNVNFTDTQRLGSEIEISYQKHIWEMKLHYTQMEATFRSGEYDGRKIYLVPEQEFSAVLSIRPHKNFTLQAEYQYTGSSYEGNDFLNEKEQLPSYAVTNLLCATNRNLTFHFICG